MAGSGFTGSATCVADSIQNGRVFQKEKRLYLVVRKAYI